MKERVHGNEDNVAEKLTNADAFPFISLIVAFKLA